MPSHKCGAPNKYAQGRCRRMVNGRGRCPLHRNCPYRQDAAQRAFEMRSAKETAVGALRGDTTSGGYGILSGGKRFDVKYVKGVPVIIEVKKGTKVIKKEKFTAKTKNRVYDEITKLSKKHKISEWSVQAEKGLLGKKLKIVMETK